MGHARLKAAVENLKAALAGLRVEEAFIPAIAPSNVEGRQRNAYYKTDEEYLFAIAEAMREEYRAIVDAGFLPQASPRGIRAILVACENRAEAAALEELRPRSRHRDFTQELPRKLAPTRAKECQRHRGGDQRRRPRRYPVSCRNRCAHWAHRVRGSGHNLSSS